MSDGEEFIVVWSDEDGEPKINGAADIILTCEDGWKIYLYSIE